MTRQPGLFAFDPRTGLDRPALRLADHDGHTYSAPLDRHRLNAQTALVFGLMSDGAWRSLEEIAAATGAPEASISARLRDLRKAKFGGHAVARRREGPGLWRYRLTVNKEFPRG